MGFTRSSQSKSNLNSKNIASIISLRISYLFFILLGVFVIQILGEEGDCPETTDDVHRLRKTRFYVLQNANRTNWMSWYSAKSKCEELGMKLAKIDNIETEVLVARELERFIKGKMWIDNWYWIDAKFDATEKKYLWQDTQEPIKFSNFFYRAPRPKGYGSYFDNDGNYNEAPTKEYCLAQSIPLEFPNSVTPEKPVSHGFHTSWWERDCNTEKKGNALCESEKPECEEQQHISAYTNLEGEYYTDFWPMTNRKYVIHWGAKSFDEAKEMCEKHKMKIFSPGKDDSCLPQSLKNWMRRVTSYSFWTDVKYKTGAREFYYADGGKVPESVSKMIVANGGEAPEGETEGEAPGVGGEGVTGNPVEAEAGEPATGTESSATEDGPVEGVTETSTHEAGAEGVTEADGANEELTTEGGAANEEHSTPAALRKRRRRRKRQAEDIETCTSITWNYEEHPLNLNFCECDYKTAVLSPENCNDPIGVICQHPDANDRNCTSEFYGSNPVPGKAYSAALKQPKYNEFIKLGGHEHSLIRRSVYKQGGDSGVCPEGRRVTKLENYWGNVTDFENSEYPYDYLAPYWMRPLIRKAPEKSVCYLAQLRYDEDEQTLEKIVEEVECNKWSGFILCKSVDNDILAVDPDEVQTRKDGGVHSSVNEPKVSTEPL